MSYRRARELPENMKQNVTELILNAPLIKVNDILLREYYSDGPGDDIEYHMKVVRVNKKTISAIRCNINGVINPGAERELIKDILLRVC